MLNIKSMVHSRSQAAVKVKLGPFGEWLLRARISKGLTQEALARASREGGQEGVTVNTISKWELGEVETPHFAKLRFIAKPLGISEEDIFEALAASRASRSHTDSYVASLEEEVDNG